jgi:serine/threonine protein kinase
MSGSGPLESSDPLLGKVLGRHRLTRRLGEGGMGAVYEGKHQELGRRAAVKILHERYARSADVRQRFLREGQAASQVRHPNVVHIYDVGVDGDQPYLVMEFLEGEDLGHFVTRERRLSAQRTADLMLPVISAVAAAHDLGVIHRDLKPENIFLSQELGGIKPKVLDFGISKLLHLDEAQSLTGTGAFLGTPHYMSPEQAQGAKDLDHRSDQYALGVILYQCTTGSRPIDEPSLYALIQRIVRGEFRPPRQLNPELPAAFEMVILQAMARAAGDRFPMTRALGRALLEFASERVRAHHADEFLVDPLMPTVPSGFVPSSEPPRQSVPSLGTTLSEASSKPRSESRQPSPSATTAAPSKNQRRATVVAGLALALLGGALVHRARSPETAKPSRASPKIDSLSCAPATLDGGASVGGLSEAIGVGACSRLAVELGVDWAGGPTSSKLTVKARVQPGRTAVDLELGGVAATGLGVTPIDAEEAAVQALKPKLSTRQSPISDRAAWGAKDADAARAIERAWQRQALRLASRPLSEARGIVERCPDSAWGHVMVANASTNGSQEFDGAVEAGLARAAALPQARAAAVRGYLLGLRSQADGIEALRLSRAAYSQTPDDPTVIVLYAIVLLQVWHGDEALALIERLAGTFPTHSVRPLRVALYYRDQAPNLARDRALIQRLSTIFPEARAWPHVVDALTNYSLLAEARQNIELGERLGLNGPAFSANVFSRASVELASLNPAVARQVASAMVSDPTLLTSSRGGFVTIASYRMEGREVDAQTAQRNEIERLRGAGIWRRP